MNQLRIFNQSEMNNCNISMVKIVIGGGTQLEDNREKRIDKSERSSLKS